MDCSRVNFTFTAYFCVFIKLLVFVMDTRCVVCELEAELLNTISTNFVPVRITSPTFCALMSVKPVVVMKVKFVHCQSRRVYV